MTRVPAAQLRDGPTKQMALVLERAYPSDADLSRFEKTNVHQMIYQLRHLKGWDIQKVAGRNGRYRLVNGEGSSDRLPAVKRERSQATSDLLRPAPPTPRLGQVLRVSMIAEDGDRGALVLVDADGTRWPVIVEGGPIDG